MIEMESNLREWGRSVGVVIPKEAVKKADMKPGDKVRLIITKERNPLQDIFGTVSFDKSTDEILAELRNGCWDD